MLGEDQNLLFLLLLFLLLFFLLQNQLLNYVQMAIDSMVRQCSPSARSTPRTMGLFSKLDLIQVRTPCRPRLASNLGLSWGSAHGAFAFSPQEPVPPWLHGLLGQ